MLCNKTKLEYLSSEHTLTVNNNNLSWFFCSGFATQESISNCLMQFSSRITVLYFLNKKSEETQGNKNLKAELYLTSQQLLLKVKDQN